MLGITNMEWGRLAVPISLEAINKGAGYLRKVSARRHLVWLSIANISPRTEFMRNQGCQIYKITGKITEKHCRLAGHN